VEHKVDVSVDIVQFVVIQPVDRAIGNHADHADFVLPGSVWFGGGIGDAGGPIVHAGGRTACALAVVRRVAAGTGSAVWIAVVVDTQLFAALDSALVRKGPHDDSEGIAVDEPVDHFADRGCSDSGP